jgi:type I restriction enzyme S subunit
VSELPSGWAETTLGAVGEYLNGRGFRRAEWRESGRPIIRIQNLTGTSSSFNYYDGDTEESYIARRGDLLVSWAATLGVFVWPGPEAVVNQHIFKVESRIDRDFHRYLIASVLNELQRQTHGSGMVHITRSRFDSTPVALPPLAEQRRIVAAIDEHFSRLDAAEQSLCRAERLVGVFRNAVIGAAFDRTWPRKPFDEVASVDSDLVDPKEFPELPHIAPNHIETRTGRLLPYQTIAADGVTSPKHRFRPGQILYSKIRPYLAKAVLVDFEGLCSADMYPISSELDARFLLRWMLSAEFTELAVGQQGRSVLPKINQAQLGRLPVPTPPLADQRRIVAEVERRLSLVDALTAATAAALKRSAALRRSVLERAFTGRLVPHDPRDEPASVLLERIRAEREVKPGRALRSKRRTP